MTVKGSLRTTLLADQFAQIQEAVSKLRRCTRCVLPETMTFIEFDGQGVCNYCRGYRNIQYRGKEALFRDIEPYRKRHGKPDCLVTFSGGRDSSYGLHFIKTVLKMNPVAYTYDWGMSTDLALRNQKRICDKLGIERIIVRANISRKLTNIRKNIMAWLRNPVLGTIPLFMAGDKQLFYYANKIAKRTGYRFIILCENMLETTRFKSGFCGVAPRHNTEHTYSLSLKDTMQMVFYYGRQYFINPAYINSSIIDTLSAFCCYYTISHKYLNLYGYIKWDEEEINSTLINEYNWETATDTETTWRIGDGTAGFYNYIYYTMAGFTENDTFRSNQVREGVLTREEALKLVERDNRPRHESIRWYCDTVGIDFERTMKIINAAPRLYPR